MQALSYINANVHNSINKENKTLTCRWSTAFVEQVQ